MNVKFTKKLLTFIFVFSLGFFINSSMVSAQNCDVPVGLNTSSISNFSATLNWDLDANADHYRLRYKENGSSSWLYEHNATGVSYDVASLNQLSTYIWQAKAFCSSGSVPNSTWSVVDTFVTANYPVDCNNTPNGTAFIDSCGNCVGGTTGDVACIDFTPSVSIALSTIECNVLSDITFVTSQDANEPDISSSIFSSDAGFFNFTGLNSNDVIGSADFIAGGGYINVNTTLMVDFIITPDKISVKAVDNATSQIYGSFTIENASGGILVVATSSPDNNNVTSGNSQTIIFSNVFINPPAGTLTFTSTINSELGDLDVQNFPFATVCVDCNGDSGGGAFTDSCGNCVGGSTGNVACIPFSPTVSVSLSNMDCDSLTDLTINVSQDPNEPDMATSLFASDLGSFDISNMTSGDVIGSAVMSANGGANTFNTTLIVSSILSSSQAIIQSQDINTGLVLGTFTIINLNPGVSISASSVPDNNNVTSGNSQTIIFSNVFINPPAGTLTFTSTINSELGDLDVQNFPFTIACLCAPNSSTDVVVACDSYTWIDGVTYTSSNNTATQTLTNIGGCDSVSTLNLTINPSSTSTTDVTECDTYTWNGTTYTSTGVYTFVTTNANGCDSVSTLNLTINLPDGCTDPTQLNYDANATCDDGSCIPFTYGCTDSSASNYNSTVNTDDGSCVYLGCTDITSCNYDPTATVDDGTCIYSSTSLSNIQSCDTYAWNGQNYSTSGVYTFVTTSSNGCDSTATLNLTINLSTISTSSAISCDTYTWNGSTYSASGSYDYLTLNADGCDSTATLNLTINGSTTSSVSVTECDTYTWNGSTYSASGSYDYLTVNAVGCDSIATLNLTINGSTTSTTDVTIPNTYTWNGVAYTSSGVYTYSTLNAVGCDSTATLNLTILTCDAPLNPLTHTILLDRATMTWDAVADADHYEIRFKQLGSTSWQYINEYSTSRTKTNLSSATSYHWQVRTHCDASAFNISEWTDTIVFQTMTPCANTTNLSDSIVGLDFATLTWDNDPNVWAYRVRYRKTGAWIFDTTYTNTITLSGLDNSSVYNWQVKSMCDPNAVNSATWTSNHQFTTLTPCDDPSVLLVDSVGINEAYLSWTAPSGTDHFVVLYSELGSGVWNSTTTANTNIALTGLATYAPYEWSLLAFCEASGLNNSDTILGNNFVTANPCTPPTGMFSSNVLLDRFTMNWNAVALADHYEIRFKEQGSAIWQMITNITNTNNTKTNLTAGNTYEWEVRSICDASGTSYSDWSATQTQATLTPCVTPLNPASANVTLTTADLSWDNDPSVWGYSVRYRISGTWIFDTTYTNTITLSGLYNSSLYNWQVKAMCDPNGNNSSPWTSNQTFNTITACSTPFNLAVNQIGLTSVKFVMSGPNSPDHYYVLYRASGATSWDTITLSGADISGNYATKIVTGLTSATTYEWQAQASCQADDSNLSAFAIGNNFTTLIPCATPSNLASSVSGDDVTFTWDAVAGSIFYTLKYKQIGGSSGWQTISNFTNPTYIVNNLGFGISYQWIVSSSCDQSGINISAFSSPDTVSTAGCPDPQNIGVTDIQTDQVKIYWDSNPDVHHFAARARVAGTTIWTKNIQTIYGNNRTVTGLVVGTTYEFQLRSACFNDTSSVSAWSSLQTFTTLADCNAQPSALTTSNITLTSADLSFTGTVNAVAYQVRFKTIGGGFNSWTYDTITATTYSLTGLLSGGNYHWQVRALCDLAGTNISGWAPQETFFTLSPCADPTNLGVRNNFTTTTEASLKWNGPNNTDFLLIFKEITASNWDTVIVNNALVTNVTALPLGIAVTSSQVGQEQRVFFTGLSSATEYEWMVVTACSPSNLSSAVSGSNFTTLTPLPPCTTPAGFSATAIGTDNATVNWGATATADHYAVRARIVGTSTWSINPSTIYGASKILNGLTASTDYEWQVRSVCSTDTSSVSAWSSLQTFTTQEVCAKPTNPDELNITTTTADLVWDAIPAAWGYKLVYIDTSAAWITRTVDTINTNIDAIASLDPGTTYKWRVRALCDSTVQNNSAWRGWQFFTTLSSNRITAGDVDLGENLNVYPNPTDGMININFVSEELDNFEITVIDAFGNLVSKEEKQNFVGEYTKQVDLSAYSRGIYLVQIKTQDSFVSKRIVLQ